MADLFSREQVIKSLELQFEQYSKWQQRLENQSVCLSQAKIDSIYCKGIMDGLLIALTYLRVQDPIHK